MRQSKLLLVWLFAIGFVLGFAPSNGSAQTYSDLHDFNCATEGCDPQGPALLAQGRDGDLYGTNVSGGNNNHGTVFRITPEGKLVWVYSFDGVHGADPHSGLTLGIDGNFYGTTSAGGDSGWGVIFRITPSGEVSRLYSFTGNNLFDRGTPLSPPVQALDGNYYGVTIRGTFYKISASGKFTLLNKDLPYNSASPLIQAMDGKLYGTSPGSAFSLTTGGVLTIIHTFSWAEGASVSGPLVQATDGNFYGTAASGGPYLSASGTVFKLAHKAVWSLSVVHPFDRNNAKVDGYSPGPGLVEATDGALYGSTTYGGASDCNNCGVLFKTTKAGDYEVLWRFDSTRGAYPQTTPMQHTNGKIYGLAYGGANGGGVLYSLDVGLAPFVKLMTTKGKAGQIVEILGQGFTGTTSVKFGTGSASSFTVVSDTYMTAKVPTSGTTGYVTVTTPSGTLTSSQIFKVLPVITSFKPTSGPVGTPVTITGSGFIGTTKVTFGGVAATSYAVDSGTQITATVPARAKSGKIAVTTPGGTASKGTFTVTT